MYCNTMFILNLIEKFLQTSNAEPHQHEALHFLDGTSQENHHVTMVISLLLK